MSNTTIQKKSHEVTIYGNLHRVDVGALIWPDEWDGPTKLEASDWGKAEFYLPSYRYDGVVCAVNIKVTGRTFQRHRFSDSYWVRVQIEFIKDGDDPNEFVSGWWAPKGAW